MNFKALEKDFFTAKSLQNTQRMADIKLTASVMVSGISKKCDLYEEWYGKDLNPEDGIPKTPLQKRFAKLQQDYHEAARLVRVCGAYV